MDVREFITDRLKELLPEYDIRPGTNIYDFFCNLHYLILAPFQATLDVIETGLRLDNYATMTEDSLDALASNFLVTRRTGAKASGSITLYFAEAQPVSITVATQFIGPGDLVFYSVSPVSVTEETMTTHYDAVRGLYYLTFEAEAALEGTEYEIAANSIASINFGPGNVYIIENTAFANGADRETNTELYNRVLLSLGLRDLVIKDSIETVLTEQFNHLTYIFSVGHGDEEMRRDLINGIHVGNMIDIYAKDSTLANKSSDVELTYEEYQTYIDGGLAEGGQKYPTIYFERIQTHSLAPTLSDVPVIPPIEATLMLGSFSQELNVMPRYGEGYYGEGGYNWGTEWDALLISDFPSTRYAPIESAKIVFNPATVPLYSTVKVTWDYSDSVADAHDYVNDDDNRVIACSSLVKHLIPIYINVTITGTQGPSYSESELRTAIETHIEDEVGSNGIEVSDLINICYAHGMTKVDLPVIINGYTYYPSGVIRVITSVDLIKAADDIPNHVSSRITTFKSGTINLPTA